MTQAYILSATAVNNHRFDGKLPLTLGNHTAVLDVPPDHGVELCVTLFPPNAETPTWKRFCDAPPPNGFYWARFPNSPSDEWTIVEIDGNYIRFPGDDLIEVVKATEPSAIAPRYASRYEYYTQPILPPS